LSAAEQQEKINAGIPYAMRIDIQKARRHVRGKLSWKDIYRGEQEAKPELLGDVVLGRKGFSASYHLCVVVDDAFQNVTHVTRGDDLFQATHLHRLLQALLHYPVPVWAHHPLLLDEHGQRFAKRNQSVTLKSLRNEGKTRDDIVQTIWNALPERGPWRRLLMDI
jgi:glutamyl-Q tRNA(Asp) synthetase